MARTLTRRRLLAAAVVAGSLTATTACGGGTGGQQQEGEVDQLDVFLIPSPTAEAIRALAPQYEEETGVRISIVDAPYEDAHQQQLLSFNAGQGTYDVVQFDNPFLAVYAERGVLAPLDDQLQASADFAIDDFVTPLQEYGTYEGQTYGLNLSTEPFLLWYRQDVYDQLGLQVPTTWDDYLANAQAIQASGLADGQIIANSSPTNSWWWLQFLWSFGGDLTDESGAPTVDTPEAVRATQYMEDLLAVSPASAVSASVDEATSLFISQDIGQMINYSGFYPTISDPEQSRFVDQVRTATIPTADEDVVQLTGWNMGIPADSTKQQAAFEFTEWLIGKEGTARLMRAGGAAIGRTSIGEDQALVAEQPYLELLVPSAEVGRRLPALVEWPEVSNQIGVQVADVLTGQQSPEEGVRALQDDLTETLGG